MDPHVSNPRSITTASLISAIFGHRNIKRLIFSTLEKYDGQSMVQLSVSQAKQIAGRAGRFGTEHDAGEVTT